MIRRTVLIVALFAALPAFAQIYTWKDGGGRVHFSDTPPATGEASVIKGATAPRPAPTPAPATDNGGTPANDAAVPKGPATLAEREQAFRERRAAAAEAEAKAGEEAAREAERQRFCEQARNQLTALQSGQRVSRFNAAGEREFLDDATRDAEIERLQQQMGAHCKQ